MHFLGGAEGFLGRYNVPRRYCLFWDTKIFFGIHKTFFGGNISGYERLLAEYKKKNVDTNPKNHKNYKNNFKKEEKVKLKKNVFYFYFFFTFLFFLFEQYFNLIFFILAFF